MPLELGFDPDIVRHRLERLDTAPCLLGLSGGGDSTALLLIAAGWARDCGIALIPVIIDHAIRAESADEARRAAQRARELGLSPVIIRWQGAKPATGLQAAARDFRLKTFASIAHQHDANTVLLGHTLEDQAETVMMRIIQGTGMRGLSGIRKSLKLKNVTFIRPLLDFSKQDILHYLKTNRIPFCRDRSNTSMRFVRNRIRKKLLPLLSKEFNPRIVQALARLPAAVQEENELIAGLEEKALQETYRKRRGTKIWLHRAFFLGLAAPLQFRVLNRVLQKIDAQSGLDFEAWQRLKPQLSRRRFCYSLPRDIDFLLSPSSVTLYKKFPAGR